MYSVIHLPTVEKSKQHAFLTPPTKYIFMQTDLVTKEDGDVWIEENIHDDIGNHWVIKTSSILKFNETQWKNLYTHSGINFEESSGPFAS